MSSEDNVIRYGSFVRPFVDVAGVGDNVLKLFQGENKLGEVGRGGNGVVKAPLSFYGAQFVKKTPLNTSEFNMTKRFRKILESPALKPYFVWSLDVLPEGGDSQECAIMERLQPLGDAISACSDTQLDAMSNSFFDWSFGCLQALNNRHLYAPDFTLGNIAHGMVLEPVIKHEFRLIDVDGIVDGEILGDDIQVSSAYVQFLSPDGTRSALFSGSHFGDDVQHLRHILVSIQNLANYLVNTVFEIRLHRAVKKEVKQSVAMMQSLCAKTIIKEFGAWPGDIIMSFKVPVEIITFVNAKPRFKLKLATEEKEEEETNVYSTHLRKKFEQFGFPGPECDEANLGFVLRRT